MPVLASVYTIYRVSRRRDLFKMADFIQIFGNLAAHWVVAETFRGYYKRRGEEQSAP